MTWQDLVNGVFEASGGLLIWLNVYQLHKDKKVRGVNLLPFSLFTLWGYWNIYFYFHLTLLLSFIGGFLVVSANTIWIVLALKYRKN